MRRPNFVVILSDELGYSDLGFYGNTVLATPNADVLAKSGNRCTEFYQSAPWCVPSRKTSTG